MKWNAHFEIAEGCGQSPSGAGPRGEPISQASLTSGSSTPSRRGHSRVLCACAGRRRGCGPWSLPFLPGGGGALASPGRALPISGDGWGVRISSLGGEQQARGGVWRLLPFFPSAPPSPRGLGSSGPLALLAAVVAGNAGDRETPGRRCEDGGASLR